MPMPICLRLERQTVWSAFFFARARAGKRILARIAIIAITTSSSMSVKAFVLKFLFVVKTIKVDPSASSSAIAAFLLPCFHVVATRCYRQGKERILEHPDLRCAGAFAFGFLEFCRYKTR